MDATATDVYLVHLLKRDTGTHKPSSHMDLDEISGASGNGLVVARLVPTRRSSSHKPTTLSHDDDGDDDDDADENKEEE